MTTVREFLDAMATLAPDQQREVRALWRRCRIREAVALVEKWSATM